MEAALIRMLVAQSQVVEMQDWFAIYIAVVFGAIGLLVAFFITLKVREQKIKDEAADRHFRSYDGYYFGIVVSSIVVLFALIAIYNGYSEILQIHIAPEVWAVKKAATILQGF